MFLVLTTGEVRDAINNVRKKSNDRKSTLKNKARKKRKTLPRLINQTVQTPQIAYKLFLLVSHIQHQLSLVGRISTSWHTLVKNIEGQRSPRAMILATISGMDNGVMISVIQLDYYVIVQYAFFFIYGFLAGSNLARKKEKVFC